MKKILFLNSFSQYGGASIACQRLKAALSEYDDLEIELLAHAIAPQYAQSSLWAWLRFMAERLHYRLVLKEREQLFNFSPASFGQNISRHQLVLQADILHLHWTNFGFLSLKTLEQLVALQKPIVWTLHDMWAFTGGCHYAGVCRNYEQRCGNCAYLDKSSEHDLSNQIWQRKVKILAKASQIHFVTCSKWLAGEAKASSLLRNFRVTAIPSPLDVSVFQTISAKEKEDLRNKYGLEGDKFYLLFGAMNVQDKRKGFVYLLEALYLLVQNYPESKVELLVVGKVNPIEMPEMPFPVHYLGSFSGDKMAEAYQLADAFALPSLEDNLPNTIVEAMACGLPCLAFDTAGLTEMIAHQENGYLASYKNAGSLAQGIKYFLETPLAPLAHHAREFVLQKYTAKVVTEAYRTVYEM